MATTFKNGDVVIVKGIPDRPMNVIKVAASGEVVKAGWFDADAPDILCAEIFAAEMLEHAPADVKWPDVPWLDYEADMAEADGDPEKMSEAAERFHAVEAARHSAHAIEHGIEGGSTVSRLTH